MDPILAGAAVLSALLLVLWVKERVQRGRAEKRLAEAASELQALKSRAEKQEFRLDRYELLWYPTVTYSPKDQTILSAAPGVPHCRACYLPLALERSEWLCRQCGKKHPESLADTMVTDAIVKQALEHFQQRHPGYRISKT